MTRDFARDLLFLLLGLIGSGAIGLLFHLLGRKEPRPTSQSRAEALIETSQGDVDGLEVAFKGARIPRLVKTYVFLWNAGRDTLRGTEVRRAIRACFEDGTSVLEATVVKQSRIANDFSVSVEGECVECKFDYLEPRDGVAIEILSTALFPYPTVEGTIRGVPKGIRQLPPERYDEFFGTNEHEWIDWLFGLGIALSAYSTFTTGIPTLPFIGLPALDIAILAVTSVLTAYKVFDLFNRRRRRAPKAIWVDVPPNRRKIRRDRVMEAVRRKDGQEL